MSASDTRAAPTAGAMAWWMVAVLFLLNVLSMLDRLILTMLVGPIKSELLISDFQMSLVLGPAFAVFYALFGVPLGWAVDRYQRRLIIFFGVLLWAMATIASGFSRSYEALLFFRICVGVGEAALAPAAVSLMADAFPRERLTTALAVFQSAAKIGAALAMAIGGLAITYAAAFLASGNSVFGVEQPWHLVMAMVGAPGLILAFLIFTFREPPRQTQRKPGVAIPRGALKTYLRQRWQLWLAMFLAFNCISMLGFALSAWMPTYFDRAFGWTPAQYGPGLSVTNIASAASLIVNGWIIDRLYGRGMRDVHLRFYLWLILLMSPAFLLIFWTDEPVLVLVCYALVQFVTVPFFVYVSAVIVMVAPSETRGQLTALYLASFTVIGQGAGPTLVGAITDYGFGDESRLGSSLAIVTLTGIVIAAVLLRWARPHLNLAIRDADARGCPRPETVPPMLPIAEKAQTDPNGLALADERTHLTWAELQPLLNRATNAMHGLGLPPGGRIAIFAHNAAETVLAYNASFQAGLSSVPVNFHLTVPELVYILQDSGSKAIFVGPQTVETAVAAVAEAGVDCRIIGWRCPPQPGVTAWEVWVAAASDAEPPMDVKPAPHLHYTSGTTGIPKSAETPPAMMGVIADTMADYAIGQKARAAKLNFSGPTIGIGPLYHTGPLSTVRPLLGGVAMVTRDKMDAIDFLESVQRYRCDNAVMVPTHFQRLLALPEDVRAKYDVSSFKRMAHTGAACPRDVKKAMIDWFGPVLTEAYGGTESGSTNMITSLEWLERPGSVGKAIPPFQNVIIGEDGQELGPYEVGTIYVRDTTGRGIVYANDPAKTAAAHIAPGVFTLGEVGYLDSEGYLFITDRVSDMIVSGGVNIYPAEAEQVLILHPDVADVAVIAAPNAEMGEEVKALVIPARPDSPPDPRDLDRHCREHLAGYKCPRSYDFVDDIGRNAMGKVNKKALMKRYWPTDRTIGG